MIKRDIYIFSASVCDDTTNQFGVDYALTFSCRSVASGLTMDDVHPNLFQTGNYRSRPAANQN